MGTAPGGNADSPVGGDVGFAVGIDEGAGDPVDTQPFIYLFRTSPVGH